MYTWYWTGMIASIMMITTFSGKDPDGQAQLLPGDTTEVKDTSLNDSIVDFARDYIGTKYKYAGCDPNGFDCSGFVYYVYSNFGFRLPRSSYDMVRTGKEVAKENYRKGDLIFFKGSNIKSSKVGHVGIIVSEPGEEIVFIHASVNKGVITTPLHSPYYSERFVVIKRVGKAK